MNLNIRSFIVASILIFGLDACRDECYYFEDQVTYEEVLQPLADIKASFAVQEDFEIKSPGNIYTYNNYLLVGEKFKGIHILDNTNPANPIKVKFIQLLGNENFAVSNDVILADNGPDLLSIDISDMQNISLKNRAVNVNQFNVRGDQFVSGYKEVHQQVKVRCQGNNNRFLSAEDGTFSSGSTSSTGKGGSMSKFAIIEDYLYLVNSNDLIPIDINNPLRPVKKNNVALTGMNVETVFPYKSYLYMGTTGGVLIYNCATSKEVPTYVNNIMHVMGCDPVVVFDDYAFSTIRGGTICRNNNINLLNVYNVSNPAVVNGPALFATSVIEPYGLGVNANQVFLCQGKNGLFVYNWSKSTPPTLRHSYPEIHAFDVIVNGNTLIVTADNGLFQFDISNPDNITYMSKLADL